MLAQERAAEFRLVGATMRMRDLSLCLLFTAAIQSLCYADVTKLPAEDRKALLDASRSRGSCDGESAIRNPGRL